MEMVDRKNGVALEKKQRDAIPPVVGPGRDDTGSTTSGSATLIGGERHVLSGPYLPSPPIAPKAGSNAGKGKLVKEVADVSDDDAAAVPRQMAGKRKQDATYVFFSLFILTFCVLTDLCIPGQG